MDALPPLLGKPDLYLRRGSLLRTKIECTDPQGRRYRASPSMRVKSVGLPPNLQTPPLP
jgi:hypothetical protein